MSSAALKTAGGFSPILARRARKNPDPKIIAVRRHPHPIPLMCWNWAVKGWSCRRNRW